MAFRNKKNTHFPFVLSAATANFAPNIMISICEY